MSGVWNSCPRSLNSVDWHLRVRACQLYRILWHLPVWFVNQNACAPLLFRPCVVTMAYLYDAWLLLLALIMGGITAALPVSC